MKKQSAVRSSRSIRRPYRTAMLAGAGMALAAILILRLQTSLPLLVIYLAAMNLIAFCVMAYDKQAAAAGASRTPELILALWALLGGTPGTLLAMQCFRHKTKKARFQLMIAIVVVVQVIAIQHVWKTNPRWLPRLSEFTGAR